MYNFLLNFSSQSIFQEDEYAILIVVFAAISITIIMFFPKLYPGIKDFLKNLSLHNIDDSEQITDYTIDEFLDSLGYSYDEYQDIFFSKLNAWQREMGYCRLYDEAAAPLSMIIDCEPIYFEYDNKKWLIEFWKGQYGMTTGCEVGVYVSNGPDLNTDFFNGTFYESVEDEDLLNMSLVLEKNGEVLFERNDLHWWLTGFKLGEFSYPHELTVYLKIRFNKKLMRDEFIKGLKRTGYLDEEIFVVRNSVRLIFDRPKTTQPFTRNEITDSIMQINNKELCDKYEYITKDYDNFPDKINAVRKLNPDLFEEILMIGKSKSLFKSFFDIEKYL